MKITLEMSDVRTCEAESCAYNLEQRCHARAITVGDGIHPACDTFFASNVHPRDISHTAGVGACKVVTCRFNDDLVCAADMIHVAYHGSHADCVTFAPQ
jgi:hypothetical protein